MENALDSEKTAPENGGKKRFLIIACSLFLFYWMGDAFLTSYYSHFFIANGLTSSQQSILLGLIPFSLFAGCAVLSPLAKSSRRALILFQICAGIEAGLAIGFSFCDSFWSLLPMTFLLGFFNGAPFAFIEGYVAPRTKAFGISYSSVRACATLGYVVALLLGYFVLSNLPLRDCYYFGAGLYVLGLAFSFFLNGKEQESRTEKKTEKTVKLKYFFSKTLIIFLISQLFLYGAFIAMTYIIPIRLKELGLADADYSLVRGAGMAAELVLMLAIPLFSKKIKRFKTPILIASFLCLIASSVGIFVNNAYALGYGSLILAGFGKAFLFAYLALFLQDIVGAEALPEALTFNTALTNLSTAVLNLVSSLIYDNFGFPVFFGTLAGLEVIGIVLILLIRPASESDSASA